MSNYTGWNEDIEVEQSPVASSSRPPSFVPALPARRPEPPTALRRRRSAQLALIS